MVLRGTVHREDRKGQLREGVGMLGRGLGQVCPGREVSDSTLELGRVASLRPCNPCPLALKQQNGVSAVRGVIGAKVGGRMMGVRM